jgi:hypothetical protein
MDLLQVCNSIGVLQKERVLAIKAQSALDRRLESFVRVNYTAWRHDLPATEKDAENDKALALIADARKGKPIDKKIAELTAMSDAARLPVDKVRKRVEADMEKLAKQLPVWEWAESVMGFGAKGLAVIVAETTTASAPLSLSSYVKGLDGIYSRLGLASYGVPDDGVQLALSTWRKKGGPRSLTADEWKAHPFAPMRYAQLVGVVVSPLTKAQLLGKAKSESGETEAKGPYGEVYVARRARTLQTHPEWTKKHRQLDAERVMLKALLADLYAAWMRLTPPA